MLYFPLIQKENTATAPIFSQQITPKKIVQGESVNNLAEVCHLAQIWT